MRMVDAYLVDFDRVGDLLGATGESERRVGFFNVHFSRSDRADDGGHRVAAQRRLQDASQLGVAVRNVLSASEEHEDNTINTVQITLLT